MFHEDDLQQRRMRYRKSQSPVEREYEFKGGGQASRNRGRSPDYSRSRPPPPPPREFNRRDGPRDRDEEYARREDRAGSRGYDKKPSARDLERPRDEGWGGKRRRDEGYGSKEREEERKRDRERYDAAAGTGDGEGAVVEVEKPNFGASGLLAKETNTVKGVELKYNEPPEARKPLKNWRLYVFKGKEQLDLIHIYKQSAYLIGRDELVTDIPVAHPSCSKQHAVIQFRQISEKNEFGEVATSVKPFIIDLDSTNGTHVNDQEIPKTRYYELRNSDVIKFGTSSREYVLLHEDAA